MCLGRRCRSGGWRLRRGLPQQSVVLLVCRCRESLAVPLRTKMTPDQSNGSPGVRLTKTPGGQDCLSPALWFNQQGQL